MEIEIKNLEENEIPLPVPVVFFVPEDFEKELSYGNCKYASISLIKCIEYFEDYVIMTSIMGDSIKKVYCDKLVIFSDAPDDIIIDNNNIIFKMF